MSNPSSRSSEKSHFFPLVFPNAFSPEECKNIINLYNKSDSKDGLIAFDDKDIVNNNIRRSAIIRVDIEKEKWIMDRLIKIAQTANKEFNYDLTNGILEPAQVAAYDERHDGTYFWHLDIGAKCLTRKLSISIPLNNAEEFEGGELQFNYGRPVTQTQEAGSAIVFPSYALHQVTPVTKGCRFSMVTWVHGPAWR